VGRTDSEAVYLPRFTRTERAVHWIHASAFFLLLATGLVLYVPALSQAVARRPQVKELHLLTAFAWIVALGLVIALGDRRSLRATVSEIDRFDADDLRWLRGKKAPQGRLNAGQKLNAVLTSSFALLFAVTGLLLWLGERDTRFRLGSTIVLHDALMYVSLAVLFGHIYLAVVNPRTRHSLRGMTRGDVRRDWALEHHAKWVEAGSPHSSARQ